METEQKEEINQLIEALMQKMPREKVMDTLKQLLHMPDEGIDEVAEYCRILDERETTNR
ncbi:hypothetical protein OR571_03575 [Psychrobacillus sp. NEAU-3TGS]|uniref:hypothetical protein n=1 Tax=Psychrobacillus sp. NEAU-3TGS TaxID=2995412 RepID=UPI002495EDBD|nr:hypothetical protein [Psychrobacillus sp. NEAU-3TGS]MDI2586230.1 hypothetical protein [Psychrobacillus sp. NEAU-3TGS]